jgi:hypothetical protein
MEQQKRIAEITRNIFVKLYWFNALKKSLITVKRSSADLKYFEVFFEKWISFPAKIKT